MCLRAVDHQVRLSGGKDGTAAAGEGGRVCLHVVGAGGKCLWRRTWGGNVRDEGRRQLRQAGGHRGACVISTWRRGGTRGRHRRHVSRIDPSPALYPHARDAAAARPATRGLRSNVATKLQREARRGCGCGRSSVQLRQMPACARAGSPAVRPGGAAACVHAGAGSTTRELAACQLRQLRRGPGRPRHGRCQAARAAAGSRARRPESRRRTPSRTPRRLEDTPAAGGPPEPAVQRDGCPRAGCMQWRPRPKRLRPDGGRLPRVLHAVAPC